MSLLIGLVALATYALAFVVTARFVYSRTRVNSPIQRSFVRAFTTSLFLAPAVLTKSGFVAPAPWLLGLLYAAATPSEFVWFYSGPVLFGSALVLWPLFAIPWRSVGVSLREWLRGSPR